MTVEPRQARACEERGSHHRAAVVRDADRGFRPRRLFPDFEVTVDVRRGDEKKDGAGDEMSPQWRERLKCVGLLCIMY
jgi:hypothetical protein